MRKQGRTNGTVIFFGALALIVVALLAFQMFGTKQTQIGIPGDTSGGNVDVSVNPAATYATQDKYTGSNVVGTTSYYKRDGDSYTTTSLGNVNPGVEYQYWVSNTSYFTKPIVFKAGTLNNNIVNRDSYLTGVITPTAYDTVGRATVTNGSANVSMVASGTANIEITYQGTSKKSAMPFGGVLTIDMNSTITSVTCDLDGAKLNTNSKYAVTTTSPYTTYKTVVLEVPAGIDSGSSPLLHRINCQFQNGAQTLGTAVTSKAVFTLIAANYYAANDGTFKLDVEKSANDDTTRAAPSQAPGIAPVYVYWA